MDNTVEFCQKHVDFYAEKLKQWEELLKIADADKKKRDIAYNKLLKEYLERPIDKRMDFLTGATGQKLLKEAGLTIKEFTERADGEKI